ncbi:MAG: trypsin-like peptidase domain-containing protein [Kiritimatiellae bacterium]|nr:trypsin-like peptidase domain-containing protein [Kiritimatiellia bacterium]
MCRFAQSPASRVVAAWLALPLAATAVPLGSARRTPLVEAVQRALPAVVNIGTEQLVKVVPADPLQQFRSEMFDRFFRDLLGQPPMPGYQVRHSLGSGVIIDSLGYILTNFHVIERATAIRVTLVDGRPYTAQLIAGDELNDLALLRIEPDRPLAEIAFGREDDLMLGEPVVALGNPYGLAHTVTAGVLSAKNREARHGDRVIFRDILQTDAAVNPGSSGGPLINADGEMIGINVAILPEGQNIGFAVPVGRVRALLTEWLSPRNLKRIWLGVDMVERQGRIEITSVEAGGPAGGAGLRAGDHLTAIDGRAVTSLLDVYRRLLRVQPGDRLTLTTERAGRPVIAEVVAAPVPRPDGRALAMRRLGLDLAEPSPDDPIRGGLVIVAVRPGSAAARAGLHEGVRLLRIAGRAITTLDDVGAVLEAAPAGATVWLAVAVFDRGEGFLLARTQSVPLTLD